MIIIFISNDIKIAINLELKNNISQKDIINTFVEYITIEMSKNSLKYSYSNGKLEGINCKIKALNRASYGVEKFFN